MNGMSWGRGLRVGTLAVLCASMLAACGGGSSDSPAVTNVAASPVQYSRTMSINVSGRNLSQGITVEVDRGCPNVTTVESFSDDSRLFTCVLEVTGTVVARVRDKADGRELAALTLQVPNPQVSVKLTLAGTTREVLFELDPDKAPLSAKNFLAYANGGFYRNTLFHRVIKDFVVQAGGYTAGPVLKPPTRDPVKLESANGLRNLRGTLAMARTAEPDSATSQWYVNLVDNASLDYVDESKPGYAVFGRVVSGLDVIDEIAAVPVRADVATALTHLPVDNILITSALQVR